jgi:hypothetical protein
VVPQLGGRLEFGDVIVIPGHYILYTGDAGLDYEIVEMGRGKMSGDFSTAKITATNPDGKSKLGIRLTGKAETALKSLRWGCIIRRVGAPDQRLTP